MTLPASAHIWDEIDEHALAIQKRLWTVRRTLKHIPTDPDPFAVIELTQYLSRANATLGHARHLIQAMIDVDHLPPEPERGTTCLPTPGSQTT